MAITTTRSEFDFLQGGGETGQLIREFDWSATPLGAPGTWPQSLRTTLSIILNSRFPMFLFWGPELICFYNDAYRPSLGNDGKHPKIMGMKAVEAWPEIWDFIGPMISDVLAGKGATWYEDQFLPIFRNGKIEDVYWTFSYSPVTDESGNAVGVFVTCTETTSKVGGLKALEASEQRFRNLIRESTVGMVVLLGEELRVTVVNDAYGRLIDRTTEQLLGKKLWDLIPEAAPDFNELLMKVLHTGENVYLSATPYFVYSEGKKIEGFLNISYLPYREADGTITGVMAICQDITEQIETQQQIEKMVAERTRELGEANSSLQKSNADLAQFAYIASHDLQEPLRKINTYSEILEDSLGADVGPAAKEYFGKIRTSAGRMTTLIQDVLKYSQIDKEEPDFSPTDLNQVMKELLIEFDLLIEQKSAVVQVGSLPTIEAVPILISQLFRNLISNSLKFSKSNGEPFISISCEPVAQDQFPASLKADRDYYRIVVADNGIGFDEQYGEKIFQIFQRLHRKTEYEGTGIGLAMCRKIVLAHQGAIDAKGSSRDGAIFRIYLPATQSN
jgi:PAS domain S-box-containing protein